MLTPTPWIPQKQPFWLPWDDELARLPEIEVPDRSLYLAAALVNVSHGTTTSGGSITIASTTAGNCIVVAEGNPDGRSLSSVTDNKSGGTNSYTVDKSAAGSGCGAGMASTIDAGGGVTSVTVTLSGSSSGNKCDIYEFSGIQPTGYVGLSSNGTGASSAVLAVTSFTPTAGNLVVACGGLSANRDFTGRTSGYSWGSASQSSTFQNSEYNLSHAGTAEVAGMTISSSANYAEVAVEYKIVSASAVSDMSNKQRKQYMQLLHH
jgi:hypothetical protein